MLVHGDKNDMERCRSELSNTYDIDVFAPCNGEEVEIEVDSFIPLSVSVSSELLIDSCPRVEGERPLKRYKGDGTAEVKEREVRGLALFQDGSNEVQLVSEREARDFFNLPNYVIKE